jgi:hypothetical protein
MAMGIVAVMVTGASVGTLIDGPRTMRKHQVPVRTPVRMSMHPRPVPVQRARTYVAHRQSRYRRSASVQDIRAAVEESLGGSVSRFSVSDFLLTRSKGSKPLFERTRHGRYRLLP